MTITVPGTAVTDETVVTLPGDILDDNWVRGYEPTGEPRTTADLRATYGTADPDELACRFAVAEDIALARTLAGDR
ncbi:hypothetical protein [Micromonospora costi]|uniref:Uncharacterized protein n=1 Tax=Micromonospora costi TaxID=1530042 RepID=A0A3B0A585_9ACTN|nr:hypothetical protein [Micromonospora costi]RKN55898.1 hypothetical protein D7193_15010 [Micromonospora costi]